LLVESPALLAVVTRFAVERNAGFLNGVEVATDVRVVVPFSSASS